MAVHRDPLSLRAYLRVLASHALLIAVVTLIAGALAFALSVREQRRYRASAQVLLTMEDISSMLTNSANTNAILQPDRNAADQARLARVAAVVGPVAQAAGMTATRLLDDSTVATDPASDFLTFSVESSRAATAERLATAYAHRFVRYRSALAVAPLRQAGAEAKARLADLRAAGRAHTAAYKQLSGHLQKIEGLIPLRTPDATVVQEATSAQQVQPRPLRAVAIGLPAGLLLGLALTALGYVLDTRARTAADVERSLRLPLLGRTPLPPRPARRRLAMYSAPGGSYAEALTALRTNVELANRIHGGPVLMATSVGRDSGRDRSATVANLAIACARGGTRVTLVDLDLRRPSLARLFGVDESPGLTGVLAGAATLEQAMRPLPLHRDARDGDPPHRLSLLPAGGRPRDHPADLIASEAMGDLLRDLQEQADLVLVDTPPLLETGDAAAFGTRADAVLVVARAGSERRGELQEVRRTLSRLPVAKLGFVAVGKPAQFHEELDQELDAHAPTAFETSRQTAP